MVAKQTNKKVFKLQEYIIGEVFIQIPQRFFRYVVNFDFGFKPNQVFNWLQLEKELVLIFCILFYKRSKSKKNEKNTLTFMADFIIYAQKMPVYGLSVSRSYIAQNTSFLAKTFAF